MRRPYPHSPASQGSGARSAGLIAQPRGGRFAMAHQVTRSKGKWRMALDVPNLLQMSQDELDDLFRSTDCGEIPRGEADGTVLIAPGTELEGPAEKLIHFMVWKGKVFDPEKGELRNEILPFGIKAIRANVYKDPSWLDQKQTIVLDYSKTSLVAHWIRDEIRAVAPGVYLGL